MLEKLVKRAVTIKDNSPLLNSLSPDNLVSSETLENLLYKTNIPLVDYREAEFKYKLDPLIHYTFKWFDEYINKNLINISYELTTDNDIHVDNYKTYPTYYKEYKVKGNIKIYRENGKLEFEADMKFKFKVPAIVNKYYFIINGTRYIPTLQLNVRPVIYSPNKFILTLPLTLKAVTTGHLTLYNELIFKLYTPIFLYAMLKDFYSYKEFVEIMTYLLNDYNLVIGKSEKEFMKNYKNTLTKYLQKYFNVFQVFVTNDIIEQLNSKKIDVAEFLNIVLTRIYLNHPYNRLYLSIEFGVDYINNLPSFKYLIKDIIEKKLLTNQYLDDINWTKLYNRKLSVYEPIVNLIQREILKYILTTVKSTSHTTFLIQNDFIFKQIFKNSIPINLYDVATPYNIPVTKLINFDGDDDRTRIEYRLNQPEYIGRICLVSTSSQNPGIDLYATPDLQLNFFGYISDLYKPKFSS